MSALCEALIALGLTFGTLCQQNVDGKAIELPADDKDAWAVTPPPLPEKIEAPAFPPVVIKEPAPPPPPPPPQPAPVVVKPEPPKPDPYRLALEAAISGKPYSADTEVKIAPVSLGTSAGDLSGLSMASAGPLDLPPPNSQKRYESDGWTSSLPVDNSRILAADRYISGLLETGFNSQLDSAAGGEIIIQTTRDIFGYHGREALVPKGSRLKCRYVSPKKQGISRQGADCYRILMGGHRAEIRQLTATVGDVQGHAGFTGEVDNRFWEKYGTAIILATVSAGVRLATAASASNNQNSPLGNIADKGSEELSQKFGEISAQVTEQTVNLAQVITASQGTRVQIRPMNDWYIHPVGEEK
ncbi:MAG: TrbI/VirB10 family protein [Alphaproteobacteria bacterium]|nr:TrbI/VirB10 family protein [Alphaproteobacteria bacterium]